MFAILIASYFVFQSLLAGVWATPPSQTPPSTLNITALSANDKQESILQCWQLAAPFKASSAAGTQGVVFAQLGNLNMSSYGVIPAHFDGGLHTAPANQYVAFVSGQAVISLPNSSQTATIYGGKHGLIFAADTKDKSKLGHYTMYPGNDNTATFQLPTVGNTIPDHTVLHDGPCCIDYEQKF